MVFASQGGKMKRIFLSVFIAICIIIPCSLSLTACAKDNAIHVGSDLSLVDALEQVENGGTIKLDDNLILDSEVVVDKKVTIDLNEHTISNTTDIWDDPDTTAASENDKWSLISIRENGNLTIKNGTLKAKENDCYAIDVRYGGKLTVENGTYIGNISAIYVTQGEVIVNGGTFDVQQEDTRFDKGRFTLNAKDENAGNSAIITVKGGKFANFDPAEFLPTGYSATMEQTDLNGDVWYTVSKNN